jgi:hypothetical protein
MLARTKWFISIIQNHLHYVTLIKYNILFKDDIFIYFAKFKNGISIEIEIQEIKRICFWKSLKVKAFENKLPYFETLATTIQIDLLKHWKSRNKGGFLQ